MSDGISVVGGSGGLEVRFDDLGQSAHVLQRCAADVADTAFDVRGAITDAGLLSSAVLDPGGFARAEAAVLAAVLGPHGLLAAAARLEERSLRLRAAVLRYEAAEELDDRVRDVRQWTEGTALLLGVPLLPFLALSPAGVTARRWVDRGDANRFLTEHPGIAEDAAGAAPTFLEGLLHLRPGGYASIEQESALLGLAFPDGTARVVGRGTDRTAPRAPAGVGDLIAALQHRDGLARGDAQGEIDIRRILRTGPDGAVRTSWVVDLPGTKSWQPDPRERREYLNDLATNLDAMSGVRNARIEGVTRALTLAGVRPEEPVMLVGHSQGGLIALRAAQQYAQEGSFRVTHVVTAGSPIARMSVPESVSVLALENRYDLVTALDGRPPPDRHNRVTVTVDAQSRDIGRNHALVDTYVPAARDADDLDDPSLRDWRVGAEAFLIRPGEPVETRTTVWDIRNAG